MSLPIWSSDTSNRCIGPRYYFDDEEPEPEHPSFHHGYGPTVRPCSRCGSLAHRTSGHVSVTRLREDDYTGVELRG